jgi:hypothetical protein
MVAPHAVNPSPLWFQANGHYLSGIVELMNGEYEKASARGKRAMLAAYKAFDNSLGGKQYLNIYWRAGCCASFAALKLRDVKESRNVLQQAEAAARYSTGRTPFEILVIKASALEQEGDVGAAISYYDEARLRVQEEDEYIGTFTFEVMKNQINFVRSIGYTQDMFPLRDMIVTRPALIQGKLDDLFQLVKKTESEYGKGTPRHWHVIRETVSAAFMTDRTEAIQSAMTILTDAQQRLPPYLQMRRENFILSVTPQLKLGLSQRTEWLRSSM